MRFTTLIEASELRDLIGKPGLAVVDCRFDLSNRSRGRAAYLAGHIPGARYADLETDLSGPVTANSGRHPLPAPEDFAAALERWGIGTATQVIVYDDAGGSFAARGWWLLRWLEHESVAVLNGGINAWIAAGGLLEPGEQTPPQERIAGGERIEPKSDPTALIETAGIDAFLADPANLLVDARAKERFAGSVEPIDTVAGHIGGAVNHPFSANLRQDGRFLPAAELRRLWESRLAGREPERVAAMCGSGVTACHNLLSLEVAGFKGAKLYAGSWSEWIRDPNRGVARGT
jgi:thiosulfate/3-mercaptopyruvate sulfurtransferase